LCNVTKGGLEGDSREKRTGSWGSRACLELLGRPVLLETSHEDSAKCYSVKVDCSRLRQGFVTEGDAKTYAVTKSTGPVVAPG
jgi:hypothetical protein